MTRYGANEHRATGMCATQCGRQPPAVEVRACGTVEVLIRQAAGVASPEQTRDMFFKQHGAVVRARRDDTAAASMPRGRQLAAAASQRGSALGEMLRYPPREIWPRHKYTEDSTTAPDKAAYVLRVPLRRQRPIRQ